MANILHCCNWFDPAHDVARCVAELQKYSVHRHRLIISKKHPLQTTLQYFGWPNTENATQEFVWADAVLFHFVGWNDHHGWKIKPNKPIAFRNINIRYDVVNDKFWSENQYNASGNIKDYKLLSSSHIGAKDFLPEPFRWLPDLIPINDTLYTPYIGNKEPCISYAKHWEELDNIDFEKIKRQKLWNTPHQKFLHERRTKATVVIDNVCDGHYGLAGLESMSMGIPTIVYNHTATQQALKALAPQYPPFIEIAPNLDSAIRAAKYYCTEGSLQIRGWMETYYNSQRLTKLYWDTFMEELLDRPLQGLLGSTQPN